MAKDETFPGEAELVDAARDLTYVPSETSEEELLSALPPVPGDVNETLVVTSLRIPLGLHKRLREYAETHGTKPSVLIRQWIELHLSEAEEDRPILLSDAMRALAGLRSTGRPNAA
jgi:predicted DNA-binding protein